MRIFTIGYEGATQPELVAALRQAGVERVIDVRAVPMSRKPGFSKNVLAAGLREAGIDYVHLKALGTPPAGREAARKGRWAEMNRIYAAQLDTPEAAAEAAQMIALGECEIAVAGGAEVMSRAPHHVAAVRFGQKMGDVAMVDAMVEVLSDPFEGFHMGITAENIAEAYDISRSAQDAAAAESHARAGRAQAEGRFAGQILPVEVRDGKAVRSFERDEHVRVETTAESLSALRPAFRRDGSVTAGNASGINDGAAALIVASQRAVENRGLRPMARILAWGHAGVAPRLMGLGPIPAIRALCSAIENQPVTERSLSLFGSYRQPPSVAWVLTQ